MNDRELLEKILEKIGGMDSRINDIETNMATKQELAEIKTIVVKIENDHGQKLGALFDGYKLNSEKLERIESEVTKHEEIILRRIR
jgi:hypothetical protein